MITAATALASPTRGGPGYGRCRTDRPRLLADADLAGLPSTSTAGSRTTAPPAIDLTVAARNR
jgi:hypothetical protein